VGSRGDAASSARQRGVEVVSYLRTLWRFPDGRSPQEARRRQHARNAEHREGSSDALLRPHGRHGQHAGPQRCSQRQRDARRPSGLRHEGHGRHRGVGIPADERWHPACPCGRRNTSKAGRSPALAGTRRVHPAASGRFSARRTASGPATPAAVERRWRQARPTADRSGDSWRSAEHAASGPRTGAALCAAADPRSEP
jgi:hypothetical protein